jgi:hypothetical protein
MEQMQRELLTDEDGLEYSVDVYKYVLDAFDEYMDKNRWTIDAQATSPNYISSDSDPWLTIEQLKQMLSIDAAATDANALAAAPELISLKLTDNVEKNASTGSSPQ